MGRRRRKEEKRGEEGRREEKRGEERRREEKRGEEKVFRRRKLCIAIKDEFH